MLQLIPRLEDNAKTHEFETALPVCLTCMTISYPLLLPLLLLLLPLLLLRPKCVIKTS
jgi:hypothetical protein